jgi:selenocysteine lyase/cysteine desulfurase
LTVQRVREVTDTWAAGTFDKIWLRDANPARDTFARLIGVPADWVGVGRATSAIVNGIAGSLPDGAVVVVPEGEHNSNTIPFLQQFRRGISVRCVPPAELAASVVPGVSLVAFSLVQSADGRIVPLAPIAEAARKVGALVCVDATQAAGWLPLEMDLCDVLVASAYKWLMSPLGLAFVAIRPAAQERLRPATPNWFACTDPMAAPYGTDFVLAESVRKFDVVPALGAAAGAVESIKLLGEIGVPRIHAHNVALANLFCERMALPPANSAILAFTDSSGVKRLTAAGITATGFFDRVRLAFHIYNTTDDVDQAVEALSRS